MGYVIVDTLSRTGVSDKTLHPSIFVWKGILLILLLFQKKYALLDERNVEFSQ